MAELKDKPRNFTLKDNTATRVVKENPKDKIEVEIGDSKDPDFKPQFKVMRWDNEVNFSMRAEEDPTATTMVENDVVKYKAKDYEVHQYEKPDVSEDGGFEFEWVLPKKPKSNVLTASLQTKGLNFFYQAPLTQEEIDEGGERPENVVGSYAVYHATRGGMNDIAGMEYKTGKAFHIYRPEAIDAVGNKTWCDLNIDGGTLTVTVPQDYLDNAVYPVVVDPTFGYTTAGGSSFTMSINAGLVGNTSQYVYTASTGDTIVSFHHYGVKGDASDDALSMCAYVFNSGTGLPTTQLAEEVAVNLTSETPQWWSSSTVSHSLANTVAYVVAHGNALTGSPKYYSDSGTGNVRTRDNSSTLPASWTHVNWASTIYSIYATYTASGGANTTNFFQML